MLPIFNQSIFKYFLNTVCKFIIVVVKLFQNTKLNITI